MSTSEAEEVEVVPIITEKISKDESTGYYITNNLKVYLNGLVKSQILRLENCGKF